MKCDVAAEDLCNALFGSGAAIRHGLHHACSQVVFSTEKGQPQGRKWCS
jgi:hypothetical protein